MRPLTSLVPAPLPAVRRVCVSVTDNALPGDWTLVLGPTDGQTSSVGELLEEALPAQCRQTRLEVAHPCGGCVGEPRPLPWVGHDPKDAVGQGPRVTARHEHAAATAVEHLGRSGRAVEGDHGKTRGHRLEEHHGHPLAARRKNEQGGLVEPTGEVGLEPFERHGAGEGDTSRTPGGTGKRGRGRRWVTLATSTS